MSEGSEGGDGKGVVSPPCFGLPSVFSADSPTCGGCPVRVACDEASYAALIGYAKVMRLADEVTARQYRSHERLIRVPMRRVTPAFSRPVPRRKVEPRKAVLRLTASDEALLAKQPEYIERRMRSLMERNVDRIAKAALVQGGNPFSAQGSERYLHIAAAMLIEGGFTRYGLRDRYIKDLGLTRTAAHTHVTYATTILKGLGVAVESVGLLHLPGAPKKAPKPLLETEKL